ncbi:LPS assembly lipoprotein LptE [Candidatus Photodesmus anomalopis]|uniref:LPS-assembly lipoprotein LptE n=1 Tax=Candidatus Photodesmus katoptron Akat1 TaxID=1236703 RepID=S3DG46_9GAMM|nr:LPS assembly lipoprotein LptE [Candidatus Photodesmus katoptron]EPE37382.1 rare lipoprotein B [Candidatus Photodesmus katoptron Akat1]
MYSVVLKIICIVLTTNIISACGFHFRNNELSSETFNKISLISYNQDSTFTRALKEQLRINKILIVPEETNIPSLHILSGTINNQNLSLYQNMHIAEMELTFLTKYNITIPGLTSKTLSTRVTRSYLDNSFTPLANLVKKNMIKNEIYQLTAIQIIRQIASLKANINANKKKGLPTYNES